MAAMRVRDLSTLSSIFLLPDPSGRFSAPSPAATPSSNGIEGQDAGRLLFQSFYCQRCQSGINNSSRAVLGSSRSAECTRTSSTEVIYPFVLQCRRAMLQLRHLLLVLALPLKPALPWHIALLSHALLRYSPFTATPSPQPIPLTVSPLRVSSNRVVYLTMGCCAVLSECAICIKRTEWRHSESVTHRLDS